jgi:hypothetical protein
MANINTSKITQFFAYIASGFIAIALLLSACFGSGEISRACESIGQAIAYVVTLIIAGSYVRGKKHVAWLVCYIIFAVAIVVLYVVNLVL